MSYQFFSDDCPGCRPAMLNLTTGEAIPESDPMMQIVLAVWARTSRKEREVFHRVTCQNSRVPSDVRIFQQLGMRIQTALKASDPEIEDAEGDPEIAQ